MENLNRKAIYWVIAIVFLFYLYMAFNIAFTQDDWTWGSSVGWGRMQRWFSNYNGRYLGNLLEILITRNLAARLITMSVFSTGLMILLWRLIDMKQLHNIILIFFLVLAIPVNIFAQTYGWGAGFENYIPAAFLSLVYLNSIKNVIELESPAYPRGSWLWMIPLGISSELFVEHVTLYNIAVAAVVIVYTLIRFKRVYLFHITYFVSVLIGSIIMFTNSGYLIVVHGNYPGRAIALAQHKTSLVSKMIHAASQIYPYYIFNNTILIIALSFVCIVLLQNNKYKILSWFLSLILGAYPVYELLWISNFQVRFTGTHFLEEFFSLVYVITLFLVICLSVKERTRRIRALFFLISSAILAAPFLIVTPLSPRCFLSSYLMLVLLAVELINTVIHPALWKVIIRGVGACTLALMVMYLGVLSRIGHTTQIRNQEIKQQLAAKTSVIDVTRYRYPQFMQRSAPEKGTYPYKTFKLFYHIPENVTVKFTNSVK